ncbi:MAG: MerR family transcriptional regulator [Gammaproteobacteria bacterium]|nr:MAG: MerR family transcriptional regulator [Gammaproteobacteria bacterium]
MLTVNQLAKSSGVPAHVARYYLRIGLIQPAGHRENGYRVFEPRDVSLLKFVRMAKQLGYTLSEIRKILSHAEHGESPCPDVREIIRHRIEENRIKIDEMVKLQSRMEQALEQWEAMPDGMPDGHSVCHLIESVVEEP